MNENMNETKSAEYTVYYRNFHELRGRIEKLNRRAARFNLTPIKLEILGDAEPQVVKNEITGFVVEIRKRLNIRVTGDAPKFQGWTLAATLEHTPEGNIIRAVPGVEIDSDWRTAPCKCDHCQTDRRRNDTHLLIHEEGRVMQVGSNCIADFLGHNSPHGLAELAELWATLDGTCGEAGDGLFDGGSSHMRAIYTQTFLNYCARQIRLNGFIGRKAAAERETTSTADAAMFYMFPPSNLDAKQREDVKKNQPTEEDKATAKLARSYMLNLNTSAGTATFEYNMQLICKLEAIEDRDTGIAAYIVEAYRKATQKAEENKKALEGKPNKHFGDIGIRYRKQSATFLGCATSFETQYGTMFIYLFDHEDGSRLKWKSSVELDMTASQPVTIDFTVSDHTVWNDWKQTEMKRVKVTVDSPAQRK